MKTHMFKVAPGQEWLNLRCWHLCQLWHHVAILIKAPAGWLPGSIGAIHSDNVWHKDSRSIAPLLIRPRVSSLCLFFGKVSSSVIICKSIINVTTACLLWAQLAIVCGYCVALIIPLRPFPCFIQMVSMNLWNVIPKPVTVVKYMLSTEELLFNFVW